MRTTTAGAITMQIRRGIGNTAGSHGVWAALARRRSVGLWRLHGAQTARSLRRTLPVEFAAIAPSLSSGPLRDDRAIAPKAPPNRLRRDGA